MLAGYFQRRYGGDCCEEIGAKKEQGNGPAKKLSVVTDPRLNTYDLRLSAWRRRCVRR
jgi:hypothetical protein